MKIQWKNLITCLAIPLAVGSLSALLTRSSMETFNINILALSESFPDKYLKFLSLKFAPKLMLGCIVSNCGTQAILRVQINTNTSWVLSFTH